MTRLYRVRQRLVLKGHPNSPRGARGRKHRCGVARQHSVASALRVCYVLPHVRDSEMDEDSRRAFLTRLLAGTGAVMAFAAWPDFSLAHEHAVAQLRAGKNKFFFYSRRGAADGSGLRANHSFRRW